MSLAWAGHVVSRDVTLEVPAAEVFQLPGACASVKTCCFPLCYVGARARAVSLS